MSQTSSEIARTVLATEAQALTRLAEELPPAFDDIIALLLHINGRIIVSGMGKSGHVAGKIAATLASTGAPAQVVHPGEASHGDLGMITPEDVVILISNSGETRELADMIAHCARFSIPMIAITSNPDSTLANAADFRLLLPKKPEACPIGKAPTTSTTLTLALGDALAVTLMERRGFQADDFGIFHPGGKLGAQMRKVSDLMHTGPSMPVLDHDTSMHDVLLTMTSKGFGIAVLVRDGRLFGVITDGDLRRNMATLMQSTPSEIANRTPVTVPADYLAAEALALLNERKVSALLVLDQNDTPVGVLHMHDFLRAGVM